MTPEDYMRRAIELSFIGMETNQGGPFGAVIVRDGAIIGEGFNRVTSTNDPTAHGEVVAIRDATSKAGTFELPGADIYTSCEPCPMCYGAIRWARINNIYFGNTAQDADDIGFSDKQLYVEIAKPNELRDTPAVQLLREEALKGFQAWTAKMDRIHY